MDRLADDEQTDDLATDDDADKDLLRGGSGERGVPTDPVTNDDLLGGGSGIHRPSEGDDDLDVRDDREEPSP